MDTQNTTRPSFSLFSLFSRFLVGFGSGFVGTILLGIILFFAWGVVGDTLSPKDIINDEISTVVGENETHPLFLSTVTLAVFLASMAANLMLIFLSGLVEEKYEKRATALTHVFFGNLTLLLLMLPAYLVASGNFGSSGVGVTSVVHVVLSTTFSFLLLEALHQSKHLIINIYGTVFGIIMFFIVGSMIASMNTTTLVFLALPGLLALVALGNRIMEMFYGWLYKTYGTDFLNIETRFGKDYGTKDGVSENDFDL